MPDKQRVNPIILLILLFSVASEVFTNDRFRYRIPSDGILLDNVDCVGEEMSLVECDGPAFRNHDCGTGEAAGVRCSGLFNNL